MEKEGNHKAVNIIILNKTQSRTKIASYDGWTTKTTCEYEGECVHGDVFADVRERELPTKTPITSTSGYQLKWTLTSFVHHHAK